MLNHKARNNTVQNQDKQQSMLLVWQRWITTVSLLVGLIGAIVIMRHGSYKQLHGGINKDEYDLRNRRRDGRDGFRDLSERNYIGSGRRFSAIVPLKEPVFNANLSCRVGDYIVSVRQVNSYGYAFDANPSAGPGNASSGPITLSIQAMGMRKESAARIKSLAEGFVVRNSVGNRLNPQDIKEFVFPNGVGCIFQLPSTVLNTHYLQSLDGHLTLLPTEHEKLHSLDFHLRNVPVPWYPHVFGLVGARIVASKNRQSIAGQPTPKSMSSKNSFVLTKQKILEEILKSMPQSNFESPDLPLPNRLVLAQDVESSVRLPVVMANSKGKKVSPNLVLDLTPHLTAYGAMTVKYRFTVNDQVSRLQTVSVWDNEPILLNIPSKSLVPGLDFDARILVYLHLYLQRHRPEQYAYGPTPWKLMPEKGKPGGSLSGHIVTEAGNIGTGYADLELRRSTSEIELNKSIAEERRVAKGGKIVGRLAIMRVGLDEKGRFSISNLQAGQYQVYLKQVHPFMSEAVAYYNFEDYLTCRFGLHAPELPNGTQNVAVHAGEQAQLADWKYRSSKIIHSKPQNVTHSISTLH